MPTSNRTNRRGLMFVISSPSGAGKTTLARRLLDADGEIQMSVSLTTRPPRPAEVDGIDYHFVSTKRFEELKDTGGLLEWAEVFDNAYATPRKPVEEAMYEGRDLLFDIDWQGARQLSDKMGEDLVSVFILPPSASALEERLRQRNQDHPDVVARRMARAGGEIAHWNEYDYVIVNNDIEASFASLCAILAAERKKRARQPTLKTLVGELLDDLNKS